MARNDVVNHTSTRNRAVKGKDIQEAQEHNERKKEAYSNPDIVPERSALNVHFKTPSGSYEQVFEELAQQEIISTRVGEADPLDKALQGKRSGWRGQENGHAGQQQ